MGIYVGDPAAKFELPITGGDMMSSDALGDNYVLFFYPRDNTSGCTKEACGFNDNLAKIEAAGFKVAGVSKDSVKSHDKFAAKFGFDYPLISDEHGDLCEQYGVWKEKSMYGKTYMGIERSTFLIRDGVIAQEWRKVKVPGHVDAVLEAIAAG